jgi:alpha-L-fucosidase
LRQRPVRPALFALALCCTAAPNRGLAQEDNMTAAPHRADWMHEGSYGIMVHYLISPAGDTDEKRTAGLNRIVDGFDLDAFIAQFRSTGADWLIFTIGQNTGYYNSPNAFLDEACPGHTSSRDLVLEIAQRVKALGKRFIAYLPAEVSAHSEAIHQTFAWNPEDQSTFQKRYQRFIRAYAVKLGKLLDGWWFDGCYEWPVFHNSLYDWPAWIEAARAGNPEAIVAFNDGAFCIGKLDPVTPLEDYHAGEVHMLQDGKIKLGHSDDSPLYMPDSRFIGGVQWHALLPVDSTFEGGEPYHYSDEVLFEWVKECKAVGGAVTLNLPIGLDGRIPEASVAQMQRLSAALGE